MAKTNQLKPIWIIIGITYALTSIPYLLGYVVSDQNLQFGGFVIDVEDGNAYISKMMTGNSGDCLHTSRYSTFPQQGLLIHLPYLWLGKLAGGDNLHDQMIALFQIYRGLALIVLSMGLYRFLSHFVKKEKNRAVGVMLGIWGGGLGWIFILPGLRSMISYVPLEFYSPEVFGFLAVLAFPHIAMARGLMLIGIAEYMSQYESVPSGSMTSWKSGLLLWLAGLFQPLNAAIGLMVIVISKLVQEGIQISSKGGEISWSWMKSSISSLVFPILAGLFWIIYIAWISKTDAYFIAWSEQNQFFSPKIVEYGLAYSVAIIYIVANIKKLRIAIYNQRVSILIIWILLIPILAYLPNELQRRFTEGSWCALVTLIMILSDLGEGRESNRKQLWFLPTITISSVLILAFISMAVIQRNGSVFIQNRWNKAYKYLVENYRSATVLAEYEQGNQIPAWTHLTSVIGLKPETIEFEEVKSDIDQFYSMKADNPFMILLLQKYQVGIVILDRSESPSTSMALSSISCATRVFDQDFIEIFDTHRCLK